MQKCKWCKGSIVIEPLEGRFVELRCLSCGRSPETEEVTFEHNGHTLTSYRPKRYISSEQFRGDGINKELKRIMEEVPISR